jgi:DNA-binding LacI/PurR family transcriptional regulator
MNERCVLVQERIVAGMSAHGGKVVQMSYHDTEHLLDLLASAPRFDAAILQSHFESIPVRLLGLLKAKTRALVVDGHSIAGLDIDRVGTDWEEALDMALARLVGLGHRRVALVSIDASAQPVLSARRAFPRLARLHGLAAEDVRTLPLAGLQHPSQRLGDRLDRALTPLRAHGLPFSAAVLLGVSDGAGIRESLDRLGLRAPQDLSVVLLGHRDVPSEHAGLLTVAGSASAEAADQLAAVLSRRLAAPGAPPEVVYLETAEVVRASVGPAPGGGPR